MNISIMFPFLLGCAVPLLAVVWVLESPHTLRQPKSALGPLGLLVAGMSPWLTVLLRLFPELQGVLPGKSWLAVKAGLVLVGAVAMMTGVLQSRTAKPDRTHVETTATRLHRRLALGYGVFLLCIMLAFVALGMFARTNCSSYTYVVCKPMLRSWLFLLPVGLLFVLMARKADEVAPFLSGRLSIAIPPVLAIANSVFVCLIAWMMAGGRLVDPPQSGDYLLLSGLLLLHIASLSLLWHISSWSVLSKAGQSEDCKGSGAEATTRVSALGLLADLPGFGTEELMKNKQEEIELEEEKSRRRWGKSDRDG